MIGLRVQGSRFRVVAAASPQIVMGRSAPIHLAFPSRGRLRGYRCSRIAAIPIQPPPLRGTSFHRKVGVATRAPSLGRGCRAQRGGVGFLFWRRSRLLFAFPFGKGVVSRKAVSSYRSLPHWGRGTASAVDRVLSLMAHLRRSPPLSFIPLVPYPARSARHLPHAGKALFRKYRYPHPTSAPSGHLLPEEGGFPYSKSFSRIVIPKSPSVLWYNMTRRMTRS